MATEQAGIDITLKASTDLSSYQYYLVELTNDRTVGICDAVTDVILGILQNKPAAANRPAKVRVAGTSKVVAGAAVTQGALLTTNASGQAVTATSGTDTTKYVIGIALEDASAAGDIIEMLIQPQGRAA